jgi:hypothetical protein
MESFAQLYDSELNLVDHFVEEQTNSRPLEVFSSHNRRLQWCLFFVEAVVDFSYSLLKSDALAVIPKNLDILYDRQTRSTKDTSIMDTAPSTHRPATEDNPTRARPNNSKPRRINKTRRLDPTHKNKTVGPNSRNELPL